MTSFIRRFWNDEGGQSLVEYTLVLAFIMFAIIGLAKGYHGSIAGVTGVTNSNLAAANSVLP
jgi:Flp pilus assembly pilin Flp